MEMFEVVWFEIGIVKYVINICSVLCKYCSVVFLFGYCFYFIYFQKWGSLVNYRKVEKIKNLRMLMLNILMNLEDLKSE